MTTKLLIDRELLERVVKADASNGASSVDLVDGWKAMRQIRAILAAPRQPEGEVAWLEVRATEEHRLANGALSITTSAAYPTPSAPLPS